MCPKRITASFICLLTAVPVIAQDMTPQTYTLEEPYQVEKINAPTGTKVKNVILMIGDGMSLMHVYTAWTANRGHLWIENAQAVGLSETPCADRTITDSGAGGTALATGHKTIYHAVGVDARGNPLPSLVDVAKALGKSAGIAVTCRLWDATPGDFCGHNINRDKEQDIIASYLDSPVDYVFGGGAKYFYRRDDQRNIFTELELKGYHILRTLNEFFQWNGGKAYAVPYDVDTPVPTIRGDLLARVAEKEIALLNRNKNGFFMMIEGSQLDDYAHFNELDTLMMETHDFDRTIGRMMQWAAADGQTLVVVTADHETGGLTLVDGDIDTGTVTCRFSTNGHSGTMVPVYAFGPGSNLFTGFQKNTDIFWKIKALMEKKH